MPAPAITITQLYDILSQKIGREEAKILVDYFEVKVMLQ
jgi:hypothetical protein